MLQTLLPVARTNCAWHMDSITSSHCAGLKTTYLSIIIRYHWNWHIRSSSARLRQPACYYSVLVGVWSIVINLSLCALLSVCGPSVHVHISGTAGPIRTEFCVQIPCDHGSVFLQQRCATLCTSSCVDDVTSGCNGRASGRGLRTQWHWSIMCATVAESDVYECLCEWVYEITEKKISAYLLMHGSHCLYKSLLGSYLAIQSTTHTANYSSFALITLQRHCQADQRVKGSIVSFLSRAGAQLSENENDF